MVKKKPKKDEVIPLEGIINELTPTLIQLDTHNIAVLGDTSSRVRGLELSLGDRVKITYKNGILLTIDLVEKKPKEMHIDKTETTAEVTIPEPVTSEASPDAIMSWSSNGVNTDVHIQKFPKCPFCNADAVRWVAPLGDCWSQKEIRNVFTNLYQCRACKLVYTDPQLE